ncbi:MAG: PAS domain-containing protein [Candidatus Omnitrophota bacterium]
MIKERFGRYYAILIFIISIPIFIAVLSWFGQWLQFDWVNEPVHSSLEAFGAVIAILIALIIWQREGYTGGKSLFLAAGFISMGILDSFHAVSLPGNNFVFLHSIALLCGGFFFSLSWAPESAARIFRNRWGFQAVILFSVLLGLWVVVFPQAIPQMILNGEFTNLAIAANSFAGILFLLAVLYFLLDFYRSAGWETYLFIYLTALLGFSGLVFKYSLIWDNAWWLWHMLRLMAYILAGVVIVKRYQSFNARLRQSDEQLRQQNIFLDNLIEAVPYSLYVIDVNTYKVVKANSAAAKGAVVKDITCYALTHNSSSPCKDKEHICPLKKVKETKKSFEVEHVHYDKDGKPRYVIVYGAPIFDGKGNVVFMIESSVDITERKQVADKLQESHVELERMVEERTKELSKKLEEMEYFRKVTVEREFRMEDLRKEIERLKSKENK